MHDFIRHLSFSPFSLESSSGGDTAGATPSRRTTAATVEPLHCVVLSFNEAPAYRPTPRATLRRQLRVRTEIANHKS